METPKTGVSEGKIQEISDLWQEKESLQMCISRTVMLPRMLLKD